MEVLAFYHIRYGGEAAITLTPAGPTPDKHSPSLACRPRVAPRNKELGIAVASLVGF